LKREYKDLQIKHKQREEEVKELKKHSKITKFNELNVENKTLLEEVVRLREMNTVSVGGISKTEQALLETNKKLQKEINGLQDDLRKRDDELAKCKKKLIEKQNEANSLRNVLDSHNKLTTDIKDAEKKTDDDANILLEKYRDELKIHNNNLWYYFP
jgi:hypothetical protein